MTDIPFFNSLKEANAWIDQQVPPGMPDEHVMVNTAPCVAQGQKVIPWLAMTPSQKAGWIRAVDESTAQGMKGNEWAKTLHFAFSEAGQPHVGALSWRGSSVIERVPLRERLPDLPPVEDPKVAATIAAAKAMAVDPPVQRPLSIAPAAAPAQATTAPATDVPVDSVAGLIRRMQALCMDALESHSRVVTAYKEMMGMDAPMLDDPADVTAGPWRACLAYQIGYLEKVSLATTRLLGEMQGL